MKVRGNISPNVLSVENYAPMEGYVEVRVRENIEPITEKDPYTEVEVKMFEYDEYIFVLPNKPGLEKEIRANMSDWLITGRTLEVNEGASVVQDMKKALEIMGVNTNEN